MSDITTVERKDYKIEGTEHGYLQVKLQYDRGGMNYFTGDLNKRGLRLSLRTVEKAGNWTTFQGFGDITGNKIKNGFHFLLPLGRRSRKKEQEVAEALPWDEIAKKWLAGEYRDAVALTEQTIEGLYGEARKAA